MLAKTNRDRSIPWPLWRRQLGAVVRIEVSRNLLCARGSWIFLLAFAPALIAMAHAIVGPMRHRTCSLAEDTILLAWLYQLFQLRLACFFGSLGIFVRIVRAEMIDRTIHYSLIAPIRREVLLVGKYLAASFGSSLLFTTGGALCFATMYLHHGTPAAHFLLEGAGLEHLGAYVGATALACFGYGAVFLAMGLFCRNPVLPAIVLFGWETISGVLPASLQLLSVTYYLKPLFPVDLPVVGISGLLTVVVEPIPRWLAVGGLILFSSVVVTLSALWFRRAEIDTAES
jgi:ABC-type transport system involved in multi-copper enzyme maturation permease subunit